MKHCIKINTWLLLILFACVGQIQAQEIAKDTSRNDKVDVDHADLFEYIQEEGSIIQKLNGNVELRQDSIYMYCDTAIIFNNVDVIAKQNVIIQQGDSLNIFADSLDYSGSTRIAELFGDVILENKNQKLFTNRLTYDLNTKTATYFEGATLVNDSTQLTSKRGYYYVDLKEAYFKDSVVVIDPQFNLRSDTLKFNTETKVVTFLGPTLITSDTSKVYCEAGFYDTENNLAEFTENAQFIKGEQQATADIIRYNGSLKEYTLEGNAQFEEDDRKASADIIRYDEINDKTFLTGNAKYEDEEQFIESEEIVYDAKQEVYSTRGRSTIIDPPQILEADQVDYSEEKGIGVALGNVIWRDTSANLTIVCEKANYNKQTDYLKAIGGKEGRPLLITLLEGDSLFMASDTLLSVKADTTSSDSSRILIAYYDVRVYKSDLQAVCDSLTYSSTDSIFRFFDDPIIWSDTSQFLADTVNMVMKNDQIDRIFLINNAFIINSPDELFFNQIKGKDITAIFQEEELRQMDVQGNAESVYYARDDLGAYVGVNETICSDMLLFFGNNEIDKIKFFSQPKATLHPMQQAKHEQLKIEGFRWEVKLRPQKLEDLFTTRKKTPVIQVAEQEDLPKKLDTDQEKVNLKNN